MKFSAAIALFCLLVACSYGEGKDAALRILSLEDSLKVYRDSLKDAQLAFSFNAVAAHVDLEDRRISLGDSCHAEISIIAAHSPDAVAGGYAYGDAQLEISGTSERRIMHNGSRWVVAFMPNHLGKDSLQGAIVLQGQRGRSTRLVFGTRFEVVAP